MSFTCAFYMHIMFRHACGVCHFTNTTRPSDITISDFWGYEKTNPDCNRDDKGISLILVNSEKGRRLFEQIKGDLNYFPARLEDVLQPHLREPAKIHPKRDAFEADYAKHGFKHAFKRFGIFKRSIFIRCLRFPFRVVRKVAKIILRKLRLSPPSLPEKGLLMRNGTIYSHYTT